MGGDHVIGRLFRGMGLYAKSLVFFFALGLGVLLLATNPLKALSPTGTNSPDIKSENTAYTYEITMNSQGDFYVQKDKLNVERTFNKDTQTYLFRYQFVNKPKEPIDSMIIALHLPKTGTEDSIGHNLRNNGGEATATSEMIDNQTIVYTATNIGTESQLALELEVPKSFITRSLVSDLKEKIGNLPPVVWTIVSVTLPALTLLILLLIAVSRIRRIPSSSQEEFTDMPSHLPPAVVGILLRGKITNRELAATLIDLARRGHVIIRELTVEDFRFSRRESSDRLEPFEQALLDQIFGVSSGQVTSEEISFSIAQELFSKRISQAFMLAYDKITELGYFYTNPLKLHRKYQMTGIALFALGLIGFFASLLFFSAQSFWLFFWVGMIISALLITIFSRGLPVRTVYADRELSRWLAFNKYLRKDEPINYLAHAQDKYLAYLPYAVIFECEVAWTRRFYQMPFVQPVWYIAANITTIDQFANKIFPLFGYLSHMLSLSSQPAAR